MSNPDKALQTQIKNIEMKTGHTLAELTRLIQDSPLEKHGQLRDMIRETFGLGYGDANTLVTLARQAGAPQESVMAGETPDAALQAIYTGGKAGLRPLHDAVMDRVETLGGFEIAPKKQYVSLRRKNQFATVGPGTKGRLEVGLNMKGVAGTDRLEALPPGKMCQYRVFLTDPGEVDDELLGWIRTAYESAG
ncbi:MAG: DUF4287 domain-containing protein [Acidobacteria bacterium]|nr:DUF4287 domain-containing protein [Acidobacteriota bacterium]